MTWYKNENLPTTILAIDDARKEMKMIVLHGGSFYSKKEILLNYNYWDDFMSLDNDKAIEQFFNLPNTLNYGDFESSKRLWMDNLNNVLKNWVSSDTVKNDFIEKLTKLTSSEYHDDWPLCNIPDDFFLIRERILSCFSCSIGKDIRNPFYDAWLANLSQYCQDRPSVIILESAPISDT